MIKKIKDIDYINNLSNYKVTLNNFNKVIVDPPRSGLTNSVISTILKINPKNRISGQTVSYSGFSGKNRERNVIL